MSDKEILEVIKEMLADYEAALVFSGSFEETYTFLKSRSIHYGFCKWIYNNKTKVLGFHVLSEIHKEAELLTIDNKSFYSYPSIENAYPKVTKVETAEDIKKRVLFPRAKHLLRTIERIEKRMLENITVTMPQQI